MSMAKGTVEKRPLTGEELQDAARLKLLWETYQQGKDVTQAWLAGQTGLGTQNLMSQYLNGHIQLNEKAVLAFARVLKVHPSKISPRMSFPEGDTQQYALTSEALYELIAEFRGATSSAKDRILDYARSEEKISATLRHTAPSN